MHKAPSWRGFASIKSFDYQLISPLVRVLIIAKVMAAIELISATDMLWNVMIGLVHSRYQTITINYFCGVFFIVASMRFFETQDGSEV